MGTARAARFFAFFIGCALLCSQVADAETLRLRSGKTIEAEAVEVGDTSVRVRVTKEGVSSWIELAFDKFTPKGALRVFDRHTNPDDAWRRLQSAKLALKMGLVEEARRRFEEAATLSPGLEAEKEAGLAAIEKFHAQSIFEDLEARLRKSRYPTKELKALQDLLVGEHAGVLTASMRLRIKLLIHLAKQRIATEDARKKKKAGGGVPPPKKPGGADPVPPPTPPSPPEQAGGVPERRTYADQRYRSRRGPRPAPPRVPGAQRPPSAAGGQPSGGLGQGLGGGGRSSGGGGRSSGGGGGGGLGGGLGR